MAVTGTDQIVIERDGVFYKTTAADIAGLGSVGPNGVGAVTVPLGSYSHSEVVPAVGVVPSNAVIVVLGAFGDEDENAVEFLDISALSATSGTDQITVNMSFGVPTSGPINIIWSAI